MTDEAKNPYDVFTKKCPRCLGCQKLHPDYDGTVLHPDGHETKELDLQTDWNKSDSCIHCQKIEWNVFVRGVMCYATNVNLTWKMV